LSLDSLQARRLWARRVAVGRPTTTEVDMHVSRRTAVTALAVAAVGGSATTAVSALGHDGGRSGREPTGLEHRGNDRNRHHGELLKTSLAPSVPASAGGPTLNGIAPGGVPWVLDRGVAAVQRGGKLRVSVRGLVIPPPAGTSTPGPVSTVFASLYCDASSTPVGSTPQVPLSMTGDAVMTGTVTLPAKCLAPLILVHPNGNGGAYIAASGIGG
jgi:hypothetical protein